MDIKESTESKWPGAMFTTALSLGPYYDPQLSRPAQYPHHVKSRQNIQHTDSSILASPLNAYAATPLMPRNPSISNIISASEPLMFSGKESSQRSDISFASILSMPDNNSKSTVFSFTEGREDKESGSTITTTPNQNPRSTSMFAFNPSISPSPSTRSMSSKPSRYEHRFKSRIAHPINKILGVSRPQDDSDEKSQNNSTLSSTSSQQTQQPRTQTRFLRQVKEKRDINRFNARGEQMMAMENIAEQREWLEAMRRDAKAVFTMDEEDKDENQFEYNHNNDYDMNYRDESVAALELEEMISQEEKMEKALLESLFEDEIECADGNATLLLPRPPNPVRGSGPSSLSVSRLNIDRSGGVANNGRSEQLNSGLYSDDAYEAIFVDLIQPSQQNVYHSQDRDMDMSG